MFVYAINELFEKWVGRGMDHFGRMDDELAIAKHNGQLHRNFQDIIPRKQPDRCDAFGASGISQLHGCFAET